MNSNNLKLIVLSNCKECGEKVNSYLKEMYSTNEDFTINVDPVRFNNGEGKVKINESIREKDVYILCDIGNYSETYKMHGFVNHKSPDDHFQDLKRVIWAMKGQANSISIVMPLLYESRQHRRKGRESLDCAASLQELFDLDIKNLITFDAHDVGIQNSVPKSCFENFYPTGTIIKELMEKEDIDFENMLVISPDTGAVDRARLYADLFKTNVGMFYKRRDLTKIVNGKNPIIEHKYIGEDVKGKNILVVDDMIASGESMLDVAQLLKKLGAENIYLTATFSLFTSGIEKIKKAYELGLINKIYTTNLTYIPENIKEEPWIEVVDCTYHVAQIIEHLHSHKPISELMNGRGEWSKQINDKMKRLERNNNE